MVDFDGQNAPGYCLLYVNRTYIYMRDTFRSCWKVFCFSKYTLVPTDPNLLVFVFRIICLISFSGVTEHVVLQQNKCFYDKCSLSKKNCCN